MTYMNYFSNQAALKESVFILDKFLGCDFTQGDFITDYRRSPNCKNLVWGTNPYLPELRRGFHPIARSILGIPHMYGIHPFGDDLLVHAGTRLYKLTTVGDVKQFVEMTVSINGTVTELIMDETDSSSFMFEHEGSTWLFIIGGGNYLMFNGSVLNRVRDMAYVPTTVIGRTHDGGGTPNEQVNLMSAKQKYTFYVDTKEYEDIFTTTNATTTTLSITCPYEQTRNICVYKETDTGDEAVYGYTGSGNTLTFESALADATTYKVKYVSWSYETEYLVEKGVTINYVKNRQVGATNLVESTDYTYDSTNGKITFTTAPIGIIGNEGADTIEIEFEKIYTDTVSNPQTTPLYPARKIEACHIFDIFGGSNDTRVFLAGNSLYKNCDWHSGLYDATYFPDRGYTFIGTNNSAIVGYIKQYNTQMIIKEDNFTEPSAYLRQFSIDENGNYSFPIEQGVTGVGSVSHRTFGYLNGEPLFLSSKGVVGIEGTNVDYRNLCQDRSEKINSKLLSGDITKAFSVEFENKYMLFSNNNVFVADARMLYRDNLNRPQYEWFYWENVCAESGAVYNDTVVFGYRGAIYAFNKSGDENEYIDEFNGSQTQVIGEWETPRLYFGSISQKKIIRYVHCFFDEDEPAIVKITANADGRNIDLGKYDNAQGLNFQEIDFTCFPFYGIKDEDVKPIHANIQRFTSVKFRFESVPTRFENSSAYRNLGFGLKMLQANYMTL